LTTAGNPSSGRRLDRSFGVLGDPLGDDGQTVRGQQLPRLGGIQPGVVRAGERALDDERSGCAVDALE
jgi:hypothetical protein